MTELVRGRNLRGVVHCAPHVDHVLTMSRPCDDVRRSSPEGTLTLFKRPARSRGRFSVYRSALASAKSYVKYQVHARPFHTERIGPGEESTLNYLPIRGIEIWHKYSLAIPKSLDDPRKVVCLYRGKWGNYAQLSASGCHSKLNWPRKKLLTGDLTYIYLLSFPLWKMSMDLNYPPRVYHEIGKSNAHHFSTIGVTVHTSGVRIRCAYLM